MYKNFLLDTDKLLAGKWAHAESREYINRSDYTFTGKTILLTHLLQILLLSSSVNASFNTLQTYVLI